MALLFFCNHRRCVAVTETFFERLAIVVSKILPGVPEFREIFENETFYYVYI